jgi:hypothetical protein
LADYRVLVTGSRTWADYEIIRAEIGLVVTERMAETAQPYPPIVVVHRAARGADQFAAEAADESRLHQEPHPARWQVNGRRDLSAGYRRNGEMVALGADVCLAFLMPCNLRRCEGTEPHDSHGAAHCAGLAREAGIPVREFRPGSLI